MCNINKTRFNILIHKWRNPKVTQDINGLNRLADETIQAVNSDPLIKDICEIFLYSISTKAMNDPSFRDTQRGLHEGVAR